MTPAGAVWVDQYPTSRSVDDLVEPFRGCVVRLLAALAEKGCRVRITSTRRPAERAWLMRGSWDLSRGILRPEEVKPHDPPIPISWTVAGAKAMADAYGLVHQPALDSRHIQGRAIDMLVDGWADGDPALWRFTASFGVHHLLSDPVHFSDDGH